MTQRYVLLQRYVTLRKNILSIDFMWIKYNSSFGISNVHLSIQKP